MKTIFIKTGFYINIVFLNFIFFFSRKKQLKAIKNDVFSGNDVVFKRITNLSLLKEIFSFYKKETGNNKSLLKFVYSECPFCFILILISTFLSFLMVVSLQMSQGSDLYSFICVSFSFFIIVFFCFYFTIAYSVTENLYIIIEKNEELKFSLYTYVKQILLSEEKKDIMNNVEIKNKENTRTKRL